MIITILVGKRRILETRFQGGVTIPRNDTGAKDRDREWESGIRWKEGDGDGTWRGDPTRSGDSSLSRYAKLDGSVTPPVVPWSCCRIDVKGPCFHDPLQLPNPEQNSSYESLNPRGCLAPMRIMLNGTLHSAAVMIAFLFVLQVHRLYLVDRD